MATAGTSTLSDSTKEHYVFYGKAQAIGRL